MCQNYRSNTYVNYRSLACWPVSLLVERLEQLINKREIIRLHTSSRVIAAIPGSVKDVSNVREGKFFYPLLEQLVKYKVTVTTGRLVSAQFPQDHFTHIFNDRKQSLRVSSPWLG